MKHILLDAYAARSCPVKTQNDYDETLASPISGTDQGLAEVFAGSLAFKDEVLGRIERAVEGVVDLRALTDIAQRARATLQAVERAAPLILGPRLPADVAGHRRGHPDALVRRGDGYVPVQVKRHRVLERQKMGVPFTWISTLEAPLSADWRVPDDLSFRSSREHDLIQLAHYWRMLEAFGWTGAPAGADEAPPVGGIIGTDVAAGVDDLVITWVRLDHKFIRTFSRTSAEGWKRRAALERYDHEHGFRVKVAQVARARSEAIAHGDEATAPRPMVSPIVVRECDSCPWWLTCKPALHDDDLSLRISKSPLDVREITVLRSLGVQTLTDLVNTDVDALLPLYLPEVRHRPGADTRLRLAARRARLLMEGVDLERLGDDPIDVPSASVEIDFDIETAANDRIYLWGFWVDERDTGRDPYYQAFARFCELDDAAETELAEQALGWLCQMLEQQPDTRVYHYSDYEIVHIAKMAQGRPHSAAARLLARADGVFCDLFTVMRGHFFGAQGLGLKIVATQGAGFHWRDEDPSGLNSQVWFGDAVAAPDAGARFEAARRVLEYNEDDVRATHELRAWLRAGAPRVSRA